MSDIRGWLTDDEAAMLAKLATGEVVLEIGSFCGKSTLVMAKTAALVYALDHHRGDPSVEAATGKPEDTLMEFHQNIRAAGATNIVMLVGKTLHFTDRLGESWASMAFVDGAHDFESVCFDLYLAIKCLKTGGMLVMHDWGLESVRAAFLETLKKMRVMGKEPAGLPNMMTIRIVK